MSNQLADILIEQGVIDAAGLQQAEAACAARGVNLAHAITALGLATEQQLVAAVAHQLGVPFVDMRPGAVDPEVARLVPLDVARTHLVLPVRFDGPALLLVGMADPRNAEGLRKVAELTGFAVSGGLAVRDDLERAIEQLADRSPGPAQGGNGAPPAVPAPEPAAAPSPVSAPPAQAASAGGPPRLAFEEDTELDLDAVLLELVERGGSDLHLTAGVPPTIRVNGELVPLDHHPRCTPAELQKVLYAILTQRQREIFENDLELDLSYAIPGQARFRVNVFQQRDSIGAVMRVIPFEIKSIEQLGVPTQITNLAHLPRGFVLVTGPTGSGKSTTLAALIDIVNRERAGHIMTIEDPIEFLHHHKRSVVNQRELGTDTYSFAAALKHVLRQDPDVILVGEMRDLETIQIALTAAETGHLVFGTLHTQDAPQTIDRVIDVFPPEQQEQIRVMLAGALRGVVCQQLLKTADGRGRVAACEVMIATPAIRNLIREGKTHQMYSMLQAGKQHGMVTMDQSLADLVLARKVTYDAALEKCANVPDFNRLCGRA